MAFVSTTPLAAAWPLNTRAPGAIVSMMGHGKGGFTRPYDTYTAPTIQPTDDDAATNLMGDRSGWNARGSGVRRSPFFLVFSFFLRNICLDACLSSSGASPIRIRKSNPGEEERSIPAISP
ncbi:hypothetical protein Cob_v005743 [Colletotrichum orbiculare MAFF 240422]|uniref:Uncharacterized protein n=1 Tax=Colletotrichum orbiculare (strain 104-T / ATCC 96160 / CBS 514.97 / LARS 414 / MAFF 240422) TaxID=1213857 RepID=A0A484FTZ4_COLOR|nr:hypothetical protein Cob_v005743 [Colletotrichum orbiculare MAFF 240422]